jgi:dipeptidyl-peptidase-4
MKRFILFVAFFLSLQYSLQTLAQKVEKTIQLEDIYQKYRFMPRGINNLLSMNDGEHYTLLEESSRVDKYSYRSGEYVENILNLKEIGNSPINSLESYEFSPDERYLLLMTGKESIYRHSFVADYFIYDINEKRITPLSLRGKQQLATFSPDSRKVAFVRKNNLFWFDLKSNEERQLTFDGEYNKIINGAPDWVYEEEFGFNKGFVWSVDSEKIGFYRFDESHVKQFNMTMFEGLYPEWYQFKYPKAGEKNSIVQIFVAELESGAVTRMDIGDEPDQYIPRIKWTKDPDVLSIVRLNRLQNHVEILHASAKAGTSEVVYEEIEEKYVSEVSDQMITYLDNREEFLIISEREGWNCIYLYNFKTREISNVTQPGYDVNTLYGYDKKSKTLYYSSQERGSKYLDTYSVKIDGRKMKRLTHKAGWNTTRFSEGFRYYINTWSDINTPPVISLHQANGKEIRILEDNDQLVKKMKNYNFAETEFFEFTTSYDVSLKGYIIKPRDFNPDKKYPLFMYVYGGPESQNVRDQFSAHRGAWFQYLVQQGYIVACVDNRGTNGRGEEFRKSTYLQLGKYETEDQIAAANYLGQKDYIDENRIGMFGWSYGGYMSLLCLFKGADVFSMAIAVAPVTNWRYYDTIYTERFMRTPQENPEGYDKNSPIFFTDRMRGKLLLIHGMGDDNVHFQNSAELVKALVDSDKQFESQFYPNKNHGIYGGNTTFHVYSRMTDFVLENL